MVSDLADDRSTLTKKAYPAKLQPSLKSLSNESEEHKPLSQIGRTWFQGSCFQAGQEPRGTGSCQMLPEGVMDVTKMLRSSVGDRWYGGDAADGGIMSYTACGRTTYEARREIPGEF